MHLLIDLQGAQTESRKRGIGRYALALTKALIRTARGHRITILLSGLFPETVPDVEAELSSLLPRESVLVFAAPGPRKGKERENGWRVRAAELIREQMIIELDPDVVLLTSLFEGPLGDAVTSMGHLPWYGKTAVILYDLIPYMDPAQHLGNPFLKAWYYSKIGYLKRADLLMAISDFARSEAVQALAIPEDSIATIYSAADESFAKMGASHDVGAVLARLGISRKFLMCASAFDTRKNFHGLVRAFGRLPADMRDEFQLVLVASMQAKQVEVMRALARAAGLREQDLVLTGYVSDADLVTLYTQCALFVFPSFQEGFGLPALEAMRCGAATIGSNATSVPEVIGWADALFDPYSEEDMAAAMARALTDEPFRQSLLAHAPVQAAKFSWDRSAELAWEALKALLGKKVKQGSAEEGMVSLFKAIAAIKGGTPTSAAELVELAQCIETNEELVKQWKQSARGLASYEVESVQQR